MPVRFGKPLNRQIINLLDRYILRNVLEPFLLCFFGFIAIWLVFDLSDNGSDFIEARASFKVIGLFYLTQLPQTLLLSLPIGLLLALLFALSKMSRRNEIISMLAFGRSLPRVVLPLFVLGLVTSVVCFGLNYRLAPHAEAVKKQMLEQITRGKKGNDRERAIEAHLFRDRVNGRTWYVSKLRPGSPRLENVHITQQDAEGNIVKKWYAERADFDAKAQTWTLQRGLIVEFNEAGDVTKMDSFPRRHRVIEGWSETPWRVASSQLDATSLAVPELHAYLAQNADFPSAQLAPYWTNLHDRWAFPLTCLIVVFIAAPLGVVYSRRGILGGVAAALFIFFAMIVARYFFLALGKGQRISPEVAAWAPNVFFLLVGIGLLWFRSSNRELPRLPFLRA